MSKDLLIVESPTKAKTISKYLDNKFVVLSTSGHIKDLPVSQLGVDPENSFKTKIVYLRNKKKFIEKIKKAAEKANTVYIATDPDREGEAIANHIKEELPEGKVVKRLLFFEITPQGIKEALTKPSELDITKIDAQMTRRILDRLVGYEVSPLLWQKIKKGLSAGRVQTVTLKLIADREKERNKFKVEEYWTIDFDLGKNGELITAKLDKFRGKKIIITSEKEAKAVVDVISKNEVVLSDISKNKRKRKPYPPYTTSTLQQDAIRYLGMTAKKTMVIAQQLFEGLDVDNETIGLITYMRTDSTRVSAQAKNEVRDYLKKSGYEKLIPVKYRFYSDKKKNVQAAHEAIRPTSVFRNPLNLKGKTTSDQFKLYSLIWNRFVSSQCKDSEEEVITIIFDGEEKSSLRTSYSKTVFAGFKQFAKENLKKKKDSEEEIKEIQADLNTGDKYIVKDSKPKQHFTQPPARYSEASLIKEMDMLGIGRPSTYAPIISIIQFRGYVRKENRTLVITKLGDIVCQYLQRSFPDVFDVDFTVSMENNLDKIEQNTKTKIEVLNNFYKPFKSRLEAVRKHPLPVEIPEEEKICSICGKKMELKKSIHGIFLLCIDFPDCPGKRDLLMENLKPVETNFKCPKCGKILLEVHGRYGRYLRCIDYPNCKTTTPFYIGVSCPSENCVGQIAEKLSSKGRIYYKCDKCDYILWSKPVNRQCPACKFPILTERKTKKKSYLLCPECKEKTELKEPKNQ